MENQVGEMIWIRVIGRQDIEDRHEFSVLEVSNVANPNTIVKGVRVGLPYWTTIAKIYEFSQIEGFMIDIHEIESTDSDLWVLSCLCGVPMAPSRRKEEIADSNRDRSRDRSREYYRVSSSTSVGAFGDGRHLRIRVFLTSDCPDIWSGQRPEKRSINTISDI